MLWTTFKNATLIQAAKKKASLVRLCRIFLIFFFLSFKSRLSHENVSVHSFERKKNYCRLAVGKAKNQNEWKMHHAHEIERKLLSFLHARIDSGWTPSCTQQKQTFWINYSLKIYGTHAIRSNKTEQRTFLCVFHVS